MKKLLIADDEPSLRVLVRATLESDQYEILEARDGPETLEVARRERPDLILLDVQMPGINGFDVCRQLKEHPQTSGAIIVMLTARTQPVDKEQGLAAGADEYLTKPFSPLRLLQLADRILGS